jgi:hypothetical protein
MTEQKKTGTTGTPAEPSPEEPRRRRRHGYRGYPLRGGAGVHFGRGFSGIEPLGAGTSGLLKAGMLTDSSRRGVEESKRQPKKSRPS